jgi:hypothetical protein
MEERADTSGSFNIDITLFLTLCSYPWEEKAWKDLSN